MPSGGRKHKSNKPSSAKPPANSGSNKNKSTMEQAPSVTAAGPSGLSVSSLKPMSRPAHGRSGRPIRLETNFFRMTIPQKLLVSQYSVTVWRMKLPEGDRKRKSRSQPSSSESRKVLTEVSASEPIFFNRAVFAHFCDKHGRALECSLAYDGRSIAYAAREVNRSCLGVMYKLTVGREGGPPTNQETREGKVEEVQIRLEHAKYLKYDDLISGRADAAASTSFLVGLDVVLASAPMGRYVQIGRSFYSDDRARPLGKYNITASAWRGFYQSARLAQLGLVVNLDESYTAFWNKGGRPLMDLVKDANDQRPLSCDDSRALKKVATALKGLKVRAGHTGITYRVHGFSNKGADRIYFDSETENRKISISEYFANQYNIKIRQGSLPCVKTNPKRDTFLPMEVLTVLENQRVSGVLSPDQTISIVKIASTKPNMRKEAALKTIQRLSHSTDKVCRDFGVKVDKNLIRVDARVLPTPVIQYHKGGVKPVGGEWRCSKTFATPQSLDVWAVINMTDLRQSDLDVFIRDLVFAAQKGGMKVTTPKPRMYASRPDRIAGEMRRVSRDFNPQRKKGEANRLQLIIVIKQRKDAPTYNMIKKVGDLEIGVATQVLMQNHCAKGARGRVMYCDNVILKINAKLGGRNAHVGPFAIDKTTRIPDVKFLDTPHIVLGADVTHPVAGGRGPSVAALVGSRDRYGVQYSASIRNQPGRQEVIGELGAMFKEVYEHWRLNFGNSVHADTVIMFRDGVSDGQFEEVMQVELAALRNACREMGASFRPKITYIIVTKRHHARFFSKPPDTDRSGNVLAGTVVDREITSREYYDFYVNSHAGLQGTSKPSKYTVLIDENQIPVDALQGYIFRLAHGFVRCNRSVSMVNSAYYAHLLAFRGRAYLGEDNSDAGSTSSGSSSTVVPASDLIKSLSRNLFFV